MTIRRQFLVLFTVLIVFAAKGSGTLADPLDDGIAAYEAGAFEEAVGLWRPLAEGGDPIAQNYLAFAYSEGQGLAEDDVEAVRWYLLAADQDSLYAAFRLGLHYNLGEGVTKDDVEGVRWYRFAAERGFAPAQLSLAIHYQSGRGIPRSSEEALAWAMLSAEQGYRQAIGFLSTLNEEVTVEAKQRGEELAQTYWDRYIVPFRNQAP
jgi:TPR repeat protein